jgi:hypothetical protein
MEMDHIQGKKKPKAEDMAPMLELRHQIRAVVKDLLLLFVCVAVGTVGLRALFAE